MTKPIAWIDPDHCIGCTKCIKACPVDAIVGAADRHHAVIDAECIGCKLCLPPCPVDCIELHPGSELGKPARLAQAALAKTRVKARRARLADQQQASESAFQHAKRNASKSAIAEALARARQRKDN